MSLLPYLQAGLRYEVTVKARNALGWGSFARDNLLIEIPADTHGAWIDRMCEISKSISAKVCNDLEKLSNCLKFVVALSA